MFFKKKKESGLKVMHYEGVPSFPTDYPCKLEFIDNNLVITKIKPEATVTLPLNIIESFTAMEEKNFMLKYHGNATTTSKLGKKYYLVIKYDKGILAFWGSPKEYYEFIKLQNSYSPCKKIEL